MSCLSKSLVWFGGIGASLILAYGSLYLLNSIQQDGNLMFPFFRRKSSSCCDDGSDFIDTEESCESDSSIDVILMYKQVPTNLYEQNHGFQRIQDKTSTLIEKSYNTKTSIKQFNYELFGNTDETEISIHGYSKNVLQASKIIDKLIVDQQASIEILKKSKKFQILRSQELLIRGVRDSTIKSICKSTGTKIKIENTLDKTILEIFGSNEEIQQAQQLIYDLLKQEHQFKQKFSLSDSDCANYFLSSSMANSYDILEDAIIIPKRTSLVNEQLALFTETLDVIDWDSNPLLPPVEVFVSYVITPHCFYIQINENKRSNRLDDLQCEMNEFYSCKDNQQSCRCDILLPNDLVAVKFDNKYYRAYIIDSTNLNNIELLLVDIGSIIKHSNENLYYLNENFLTRLPFQAIQCSLYNISNDIEWTKQEIDYFRELTREGLWESLISVRCYGRTAATNSKCSIKFLVEMFRRTTGSNTVADTVNVGKELEKFRQKLNNTKV